MLKVKFIETKRIKGYNSSRFLIISLIFHVLKVKTQPQKTGNLNAH